MDGQYGHTASCPEVRFSEISALIEHPFELRSRGVVLILTGIQSTVFPVWIMVKNSYLPTKI